MGYGQGGYSGDINEISAALDAGADIEGVTSTQGTTVSPVEQQITFGGYPNQIGPSAISQKGLINKEAAWSIDDIVNSLHPDFVANASPEELDYAISIVQGKAKYEEGALSGPTVSRQPPWAGTRTQTTGTGQTGVEATVKEINKYEKAIKETEKSQAKIAKMNKELEQKIKNIQRWYTSPARAEALLGPPLPQVGGGGDVGAYIEQQQMGMGPPLGGGNMPTYSGTPTRVEDESAWGAGGYTPVNPSTRPASFEQWQDLIENPQFPAWEKMGNSYDVDVPKAKATAKSKYGAWKGKYNKLTAKQNLENLATFRKGWMTDFEKRLGSAKHFGLTRPTVNGKQISVEDNRLRNQIMRTDEFLNAYDSVYGTSKGAKMIGSALSMGIGTVGNMAQSFVNKKGAGNADEFKDTVAKVTSGEYEGQAESAPTHPRDTVSSGFWGLLSFAKENKKLFKSLSGEELWALVSDPDEFWQFYEDALNAQ